MYKLPKCSSKRSTIKNRYFLGGLIVLLAGAIIMLIAQRSFIPVQETSEVVEALNVTGLLSIFCTPVYEDGTVYLSGECFVVVDIVNNENGMITVHGVTVYYDGIGKRIDIPLNVTVGPGEVKKFTSQTKLHEKMYIYANPYAFMYVEYLGRFSRIPIDIKFII